MTRTIASSSNVKPDRSAIGQLCAGMVNGWLRRDEQFTTRLPKACDWRVVLNKGGYLAQTASCNATYSLALWCETC